MFRRLAIALAALLILAGVGVPCLAADDLESQVREIERLSTTAPPRESNARIDALAPQLGALTTNQRQRVEYVRLRNLALSGNELAGLRGLASLLKQDMSVELRLQIYGTAIHIAANVEDWSLAFAWLNEALVYLPSAPSGSARLLGAASYLYTLVGETGRARDLALRALRQVEADGSDPLGMCRALANVALAEDHAGNFQIAERWRQRQIEACTRAGDRIFIANGKYGVGKMAVGQERYAEALDWGSQALAEFEEAGFEGGAYSARLLVAESLIALDRNPKRADALLERTLEYYRQQQADAAISETQNLLARLAERAGNQAAALTHLKAAIAATAAAERKARKRQLAYLQVQFDTQAKEQQIALLEAEKRLAEAQAIANQRRQLLLVFGLGGLLITAVLLSILLRRSARARQRYRWQSEHDSLTRLYNYQQVRKLGEPAFARARASGRPFTAVVIDIDLFKQVNDRYGHAAGDAALRALGSWISEAAGSQAIAGRSGGDEFTVLLEGGADDADALLQRLRDRIEPVTVFGRTFEFNISAGLCQARAPGMTLEQLVHEADQALYRAKHEGRDRVVRAGDDAAASGPAAGLVVVGGGIQFGRHVSGRCLAEIRSAQVAFCLADPFALAMVSAFRPDVINLGSYYTAGKDRRQAGAEIQGAILKEVRAAKQVCVVFYGHPGVFSDIPQEVTRKARAEGFPVRVEPGISAAACLREDLGLDAGGRDVQSMEATAFLFYDHQPDPSGLVLLWQAAGPGNLAGDYKRAESSGLQALAQKLLRWYPPTHEVILYEAPQLAVDHPRAEHLTLRDLPAAHFDEYTMLVIPPLDEQRPGALERRRYNASPA